MGRKNKSVVKESNFARVYEIQVGNKIVSRGDMIKISGEYGGKFRFHSLVTNTETGAEWIDCFELQRGVASAWRSFRSDRIKLIPKKRSRKDVN
jgi:hypothetical protein